MSESQWSAIPSVIDRRSACETLEACGWEAASAEIADAIRRMNAANEFYKVPLIQSLAAGHPLLSGTAIQQLHASWRFRVTGPAIAGLDVVAVYGPGMVRGGASVFGGDVRFDRSPAEYSALMRQGVATCLGQLSERQAGLPPAPLCFPSASRLDGYLSGGGAHPLMAAMYSLLAEERFTRICRDAQVDHRAVAAHCERLASHDLEATGVTFGSFHGLTADSRRALDAFDAALLSEALATAADQDFACAAKSGSELLDRYASEIHAALVGQTKCEWPGARHLGIADCTSPGHLRHSPVLRRRSAELLTEMQTSLGDERPTVNLASAPVLVLDAPSAQPVARPRATMK